jgi:hypothetical protein
MQKSNQVSSLAKSMILFQVKVESIKKDAKNPFFKSSYASLSNILDAIKEPLIESGLSILQFPTGDYGLTTILLHESGEYLKSEYTMRPVKDDPQGRGSAITYARRYALASVLCLNIDEDDDGNTATYGGKNPQEAEDNNKQWLNKGSKDFENAKEKLATGKITIADVRKHYKVSKEVESLLINN